MQATDTIRDTRELANRFVVNLYKKKIRDGKLDPRCLKGTWSEASTLLETRFDKVSRIENDSKLVNLYLMAIGELNEGNI
jgi:hypothetical protein